MSTIDSAAPVFSPLPINTITPPTTTISEETKNSFSPSDSFAGSFVAMSSTTDPSTTPEPDKKAGFFKRMAHGLGNGFGKIADMMGLGHINKFAKEQFKLYDTDKSNQINATEFSAVSSLVSKSFQEVDRNANQEVSYGEFHSIVRDLVKSELAATDTNTDGFVNFNEANARGLVKGTGPLNNTFVKSDANADGLLSFNEFADLINTVKLKKTGKLPPVA